MRCRSDVTRIRLDADGLDQSDALAAQLAGVAGRRGARGLVRFPRGTFRLDAGIQISDAADLVFDMRGFTSYTDRTSSDLGAEYGRAHLRLVRCHSVRVFGPTVVGPNDERDDDNPAYALYRESLASDHAFAITSGCTNVGLYDASFSNVYGDGLYVGYHNDGVANERIRVKRLAGTHCGRQGIALTHAVDIVLEDCTVDYASRSGLDIEPNHAKDKVWDATLRRCAFGSQFYPFTITGASGTPAQRQDILLEDCRVIRCPSNHPAVLATRGPSTDLTIRRLTDTRNSHVNAFNLGGAWENVTIDGSTVTTARSTPESVAVRANVSGTLTITDNVFNGKPGTEGFDRLYETVTTTPAHIVTHGNAWAMGTQTD